MRATWVVVAVLGAACAGCSYDGRGVSDAPAGTADAPAVGDDGGAGADARADAPVPVPDAAGCPMTYAGLAGGPSVYRVVDLATGGATWIDAELDCRDDGAGTHLAIAETMPEHQAFVDAMSGASRWLGVTDRVAEGAWIPIIGGGDGWYADWAGGSPDQYDCLLLSRIPAHEAMPCNDPDPAYHEGFICECDGHPVDVTTF